MPVRQYLRAHMYSPLSHALVDAVHEDMRRMTAAAVDFELRSMSSVLEMSAFLDYLAVHLKRQTDFDLIQAYFNVFIKVSSSTDPLCAYAAHSCP